MALTLLMRFHQVTTVCGHTVHTEQSVCCDGFTALQVAAPLKALSTGGLEATVRIIGKFHINCKGDIINVNLR